MLIQSICITVTGAIIPKKGPITLKLTAVKLTVSWKIMNFLILLNIVLPNRIVFTILIKLLSNMIMSLVSFETSVPLPIAKPTSARFKAGASFIPSPVIPVTKPNS